MDIYKEQNVVRMQGSNDRFSKIFLSSALSWRSGCFS